MPEVAALVVDRTGGRTVWNQGTGADADVDRDTRALLARQLDVNEAVQIALLNNRSVQATYEELGVAQGELVQAGLLTNPIFTALLRFPDGARGDPDLEISVSQNFIELLSLPLKKRVAAAQFEAAKARVAGQIIDLAADVREAFYTLQGEQQMLDLRRAVTAATDASAAAEQHIRDAGNTTELALASQQAIHAQAVLDQSAAEVDVVKSRERLTALLGLTSPGQIKLAPRLPDLPSTDGMLDDAEQYALQRRLDFKAAVADLNATYETFGLTRRFTWLSDTQLSVDAEHNPDGSNVVGPGVSIPIPIFDDGTAQVAVARGRVRQATQRLAAMRLQIVSDVRSQRAQMFAARARADYVRATLLPLRQKITRQTQLQFNGMLAGVFQLLQAKRDEIEAGQDYITALRDYWLARTQLERATGGTLPASTTQPAIQNFK